MKLHEIKQLNESQFLTDHDEIKAWLNKMEFWPNVTIQPNGIVDVDGAIDLENKKLTRIPVQFGKTSEYFDCSMNQLISFDGFPAEIRSWVSFAFNGIESLEGISDVIKSIATKRDSIGRLNCFGNPIKSGGIGLLLIDGVRDLSIGNFSSDLVLPFRIIQKYLGRPDDIYDCQAELVAAGYEEFAKI